MPAVSLHCPTCGAPASSDARRCTYCDTQITAVQCASCFGAMFAGSRFCPHCGQPAGARRDVDAPVIPCPRCSSDRRVDLRPAALRTVHFDECPDCGGVWLDRGTFERIAKDSEAQSAALDLLGSSRGVPERRVRYVRCPLCDKMMARHNYARRSGVVLDRCPEHGVWFDHDELRQVVEFIRCGGLEDARRLDAERERVDAQRRADENFWLGRLPDVSSGTAQPSTFDDRDPGTWLRRLLSEILNP